MANADLNTVGKVLPRPAVVPGRAVAVWLFGCCAMVIGMMLIGAVTRLTGSGLSITEWQPIIGIVPPLSEADWQRAFDLYRETSQYRLQNAGMTLAEFKSIFWWEYIHRAWGRLIGLVFAVPLAWFLVRRQLDRRLTPHLIALFLLGGLQGFIGWWMVTSGLVDRTSVSQYRLAVHLGLAFVILGYMLWLALGIVHRRRPAATASAMPLHHAAVALLALVFATILSGALVAGLNAGMVYNDWPLMGGQFVPQDYAFLNPWWLNLFENPAAVQFDHRIMAYLSVAACLALWLWARRIRLEGPAARAIHWVAIAAVAQIGLGIATLVHVVPLSLAVAHQAGAVALFCVVIYALHALRR